MLVIVRHGQSEANANGVFAGWIDTPLTQKGITQAKKAGKELLAKGFNPDAVYSSTLTRTICTARNMLSEMNSDAPIVQRLELVERHYGGLTGMYKDDAVLKYGTKTVQEYRRSFDVPPPAIEETNTYFSEIGTLKSWLPDLPVNGAESLADVIERVKPFLENELMPMVSYGKNVLVVGHGNTLRALTMLIKNMTPEEVIDYEIENGVPIVMEI